MVDRRSAEQYEILTTKTNQDKSIIYYEKRKKKARLELAVVVLIALVDQLTQLMV